MWKPGKWLWNFLTGKQEKKKDKEKEKPNTIHQNSITMVENPSTPIAIRSTTPKEKRRWSFRRSAKDLNSAEATSVPQTALWAMSDGEDEQKQHTMAMAVAAAQAAAAIHITAAAAASGRSSAIEEAAAIKIQSVFRSYLARKALRALRGLVKLQALVRGHLVRKQATATLRRMLAMVTAQARAQAQRIRMTEEGKHVNQRQSPHRKSTQENRHRPSHYELGRRMEENIKIVEMDYGETKGNTRACSSGHFDEFCYSTAKSSPDPFAFPPPDYAQSLSYDYPLYPNYMANTESSSAKVRSQSAPKQRPPYWFERQTSRRKPSLDSRNVPMQRSSSNFGSAALKCQHPWSIKLDKSTVSLKDSECGSTNTLLTNTIHCRSLVGFDVSISTTN